MKTNKMLVWFGLKFNPFSSDIPGEDLYISPGVFDFCKRVETICEQGGFALLQGEPGLGKSVALRIIARELEKLPDVKAARLTRPQSNLIDFYQEIGKSFGVSIKHSNRWGGFNALRQIWLDHIKTTLYRPVLLIDEASLMRSQVLNEIRILSSMDFDSKNSLAVILCGDRVLTERLRTPDLLPLGSRIKTRMHFSSFTQNELHELLEHLLKKAGNPNLLTQELKETLVDHSMGNLRILANMGSELLHEAMRRELTQLDETLYLQYFHPGVKPKKSAA